MTSPSIKLNLPISSLKLRESARNGNEIFDPLRKKWLVLTPEEWVRQNFTAYLRDSLSYPSGLMANEVSIRLNGTSKRCDTVIYSNSLQPIMIVEYKAPTIEITQEVFNQIGRYNLVLGVDYLTVSNGLKHFCCKLDRESGKYRFLKEIPIYSKL